MRILNLGCGTKTSAHPNVVNIDWSIYLRFKRNRALRAITPLLIGGERLERFRALADNIMVHNLAKGIPFESGSVDVVYHSHLLEHLDREVAKRFLLEVKRVLAPGGIQRIVVPDLERACREYLADIARYDDDVADAADAVGHEVYVSALLEQSVRREAFGTSQRGPLRRFLENAVLGDARRRGETHQWMYDRVSLVSLLSGLGYRDSRRQSYDTSLIPSWSQYGLDLAAGGEYKPGSLYIEARK